MMVNQTGGLDVITSNQKAEMNIPRAGQISVAQPRTNAADSVAPGSESIAATLLHVPDGRPEISLHLSGPGIDPAAGRLGRRRQ